MEAACDLELAFSVSLEQVAAALSPLRASSDHRALARTVVGLLASSVAVVARVDVYEEEPAPGPARIRLLARSARTDRADVVEPERDRGTAVAVSGDTAVVEDAPRALSWVVVPLLARGRAVGSLRVALDTRETPAAPALPLVRHVAASLASGLSAAELHEQAELVSRRLQQSLLPRQLPEAPWFRLAARYAPATSGMYVGGDWYDAQLMSPDELAFSVGDVAGHGVEAAARMGELRSAIAALRMMSTEPHELVEMVRRVCEPADYFATALCARVSPSGALRWASAGHPPPVVVHGGSARLLRSVPSPPLGVAAPAPVAVNRDALGPGDAVVLYTDGLVERRDEPIDESLEGLIDDVTRAAHLDPDALADSLLESRRSSSPTRDDIALVVVRLVPDGR